MSFKGVSKPKSQHNLTLHQSPRSRPRTVNREEKDSAGATLVRSPEIVQRSKGYGEKFANGLRAWMFMLVTDFFPIAKKGFLSIQPLDRGRSLGPVQPAAGPRMVLHRPWQSFWLSNARPLAPLPFGTWPASKSRVFQGFLRFPM